jgi:uncharacterized protein (DUF1501 family)
MKKVYDYITNTIKANISERGEYWERAADLYRWHKDSAYGIVQVKSIDPRKVFTALPFSENKEKTTKVVQHDQTGNGMGTMQDLADKIKQCEKQPKQKQSKKSKDYCISHNNISNFPDESSHYLSLVCLFFS